MPTFMLSHFFLFLNNSIIKIRTSVRMLLETIFANMEKLKLKCSKENNTVLCIIIRRKA